MTGFFRRFIKNYARIAKPLNDILEGEASQMKSEAVTLPLEAMEVFERLKMCCMTAPVLAFPNFEKEFQLETDASSEGLGAVLSQKQSDGKWHPIAFGSRELKGGEAKYHSSKLEFLALKWAITEQFREYLQYRPFTVLMHNNPLTYIFGFPQKLMLDQGTEFTGDVIAAMCKLLGIEKIRTTPYHPQTNGSAERVHQTLQRMIGKLDPEKCGKWPEHIGSVLIAYNATQSQVTGYSPYFLMFRWRPRLPVDLLFPTVNTREWTRTIDEYVKALYEWLTECLQLAQESASKEAKRQKWLYNRWVGAMELHPGDHVLVRLDAFRGQHRKLKKPMGR